MKAPLHLRLAGGLLLAVGMINLVGTLTLNDDSIPRSDIVWNVVVSLLVIVIGGGLVLQQRWAWPLGVLVGAAAVGFGVYLAAQPGDIIDPGANVIALLFFVLPGALLLAGALSPSSRRWRRWSRLRSFRPPARPRT